MIEKYKQDICEIGRRLYNRELVAANDGNISIKVDENKLLITPTMMSKGYMVEDDIILIDYDGNVLMGSKKPSSEYLLHTTVYKNRQDINAIVHAHPVTASAFAVCSRPVDMRYMPEAIMSLGVFPVAEYARPGTKELALSIMPYINNHNGCLLSNHGAVCWSKDVYSAYYLMEQLEFYCKTSLIAEQIGNPKIIP